MRVLAVGNMYPPHHLGGYELVWRSAMDHLRAAGHEVRVLTTDHRVASPPNSEAEPGVHRELRWYWRDHAFPRRTLRDRVALERHNAAVMDRHLGTLRPDVVTWWPMGGMSMGLIERVRRAGIPAAGFVHDAWLVYGPLVDQWLRAGRPWPWLAERLGRVPARVELDTAARWVFVSVYMRDHALDEHPELAAVDVLHSGIDPALVTPAAARDWEWDLLYVGRIDERKGIDVAVAALAHLPAAATLTVVGGGDAEAARILRAQVAELGLTERVHFEPARPRAELPSVFAAHDAVVFPVRWPEPWGLVPLEAMASGRPVLATGTGGSAEFLRDGENALLTMPGDPASLARGVRRLAADPELRARLRTGGLACARAHTEPVFNRAVEATLERLVSEARR